MCLVQYVNTMQAKSFPGIPEKERHKSQHLVCYLVSFQLYTH